MTRNKHLKACPHSNPTSIKVERKGIRTTKSRIRKAAKAFYKPKTNIYLATDMRNQNSVGITLEDIVEEPIKQIKVKRRAARLYLTDTKDGDGNIIIGKVFVDGTYLHAYTPETMIFCPGCECGKDPDKIPCGLGSHTIEVDGTTAGKYIPWTFGSGAVNFAEGDDFVATPILYEYPEVPIAGTVYNFDLPDEIYIGEGSNYRFTVRNLTDSDIPVQLKETLEFRSVDMDPPKKYTASTDWGYYARSNDLSHVLHYALPTAALKSDMLYAFYDVWSILEGKW